VTHARRFLACLLLALALCACAKTQIADRTRVATGPIPRPGCIWVYPFAATPADLPRDSSLPSQYSQDPTIQTPEHVAMGKKLGQHLAVSLAKDLNEMGMKAQVAGSAASPAVNDLVIRGYLLSLDEGSAGERFGIGLGAGASELRVAAEGFQMTASGLRKLAYGSTKSASAKTPGAGVGAAAFLITASPIGLIASTGMKAYGEMSGSATLEGRAEKTAKEISESLKARFKEQGWIH
jgi:hypothetical protein